MNVSYLIALALGATNPIYFVIYNKSTSVQYVASVSNISPVKGSNFCRGSVASVTPNKSNLATGEIGVVFFRSSGQSCEKSFFANEYFIVRNCIDLESTLRLAAKIEGVSLKPDDKNLVNYVKCNDENTQITIKKKFGPSVTADVNYVNQVVSNITVFDSIIDPAVGWGKKLIDRNEAFHLLANQEQTSSAPSD
jgi:hypothetical protein